MLRIPDVLPIPAPIHDRLDSWSRDILTEPGAGVDFAAPPGEPALVAPDSVSWQVFKNPVTLFVGGVTAVLLELAEPRVRDGVWHHTTFRTEPLKRLQRTGLAAMITVYGARSQAEAMIAGVTRAHGRVQGTTSDGIPYQATDPELMNWVQATASFGFLEAYSHFARPLSTEEWNAGLAEAAPAARLYGAIGGPTSRTQLNDLFEAMKDRLVPSPIIFEFLDIMRNVDALPSAGKPLQLALVKAAVSLLPIWVRDRLGIDQDHHLSRHERLAVRLAAKGADRLLLKSSPPVQACRRLGLPDNFLYRRPH